MKAIFVFLFALGAFLVPSQAYHRAALKYHNKYRSLHGAADLQLDDELNRAAEDYITEFVQSSNGRVRPKQRANLGQNLFQYRSGTEDLPSYDDLVEMAVDSWYSDIKKYDWRNPKVSTFSQVVWRASKKLGVAVGRNGGGKAVVVAMYSPPGNVLGQFQDNVRPVGDYPPEEQEVVVNTPQSTTTKKSLIQSQTTRPTTTAKATTVYNVPQPTERVRATNAPVVAPQQSTSVPSTTATTSASLPPSNNGPAGAEVSERDVQILAVDMHNAFREKHGSPALRLDDDLTKAAQDYAYSLASGKSKRRTEHGQNLFWFSGFSLPPDEAVRKAVNEWYNAKSVYNWREPLSSPTAANAFSQLLWKASRKIGVGVATKRNGNVVVALYGPPGNILSEKAFLENVAPEI